MPALDFTLHGMMCNGDIDYLEQEDKRLHWGLNISE